MFGLALLATPLARQPWPPLARAWPPQLSAAGAPPPDKQMSSEELVTYAEVNEDFRRLMGTALSRIDRNRAMQGKKRYETVEGMIDAYVDEAANAGLGWTRAEAESEVVR